MKHFYYFSKKKLKFVEIKDFYKKFIFLIGFFAVISSFFIFSVYFMVKEIINPDAEVESLLAENRQLSEKLDDLLYTYKEFDQNLNELSNVNNDLRLAVNLDPIDDEDKKVGMGGKIFNDITPTSSADVENLINNIDAYVERVSAKLNFEKNNYNEISKTLELNKKLYEAIPAIVPTNGTYGDRFGMRLHPILKVRRMHNGVDLIANVGTPIYAPGGGKVEFAGRRGGYGWTLEIDHGFGYKTLYAHLSKIIVKKGQKVTRGDLIAHTGSSGKLSTGPHLHYEIRHNGIALNPRNFIYDDVNLFEIISEE
ncbi:MAG: peptidoglycan DD-metalloendopeptidase family protein [Melioribacteraceae bacterium]|nr:peptidoglycan DD-metalloendopeptidase family protein [Melioribacteraceae bacterium]MCF8352909.1 peptidoglycan DD-metalloendopeptidase family protein [Melioribacteraceae bacterium]MCF8395250.1 peptidoglycan DD-metalloendopeptidase family protein [Melioribacteraceae bacterium]MCF8417426.1 peptidoglycan DD-metalloendopeptidase family protein [Melioribacteraceae bacterium]